MKITILIIVRIWIGKFNHTDLSSISFGHLSFPTVVAVCQADSKNQSQ